jgi:hypothetical protein
MEEAGGANLEAAAQPDAAQSTTLKNSLPGACDDQFRLHLAGVGGCSRCGGGALAVR